MHFFNPATIMKLLVEVVTTADTSADVNETVLALCANVGKVAVSCSDRSGFIVNCLLFPYLNDAVTLLESGAASMDEINAAIKEQAGFPMGPFQLLDVVGNDVSLAIQQAAVRGVQGAGLRAGRAARAEGRRGSAGSQDRQGLPRLQLTPLRRAAGRPRTHPGAGPLRSSAHVGVADADIALT